MVFTDHIDIDNNRNFRSKENAKKTIQCLRRIEYKGVNASHVLVRTERLTVNIGCFYLENDVSSDASPIVDWSRLSPYQSRQPIYPLKQRLIVRNEKSNWEKHVAGRIIESILITCSHSPSERLLRVFSANVPHDGLQRPLSLQSRLCLSLLNRASKRRSAQATSEMIRHASGTRSVDLA